LAHLFAPTLTHARLRAVQGDLRGARRILREILERDPRQEEARQLLGRLEGLPQGKRDSLSSESLPQPAAADAKALAGRFRGTLGPPATPDHLRRIERLRRWLRRIERHRASR
jgi:hypothetical protein